MVEKSTEFVLVQTRPKMDRSVYKRLEEDKRVVYVHPLFGEYDMIAKVQVDGPNEMNEYLQEMLGIEGVLNIKHFTVIKF